MAYPCRNPFAPQNGGRTVAALHRTSGDDAAELEVRRGWRSTARWLLTAARAGLLPIHSTLVWRDILQFASGADDRGVRIDNTTPQTVVVRLQSMEGAYPSGSLGRIQIPADAHVFVSQPLPRIAAVSVSFDQKTYNSHRTLYRYLRTFEGLTAIITTLDNVVVVPPDPTRLPRERTVIVLRRRLTLGRPPPLDPQRGEAERRKRGQSASAPIQLQGRSRR